MRGGRPHSNKAIMESHHQQTNMYKISDLDFIFLESSRFQENCRSVLHATQLRILNLLKIQ